jgi:ATP-dependent Lon protease
MGGKLLLIEAIKYSNSKSIIHVTGQLGDVIKESINIALSWIKSNRNDLPIWCGGEFYKITKNID